jgi:hypothetical protein
MTLDKADTNKYYKRKHWDAIAIKFILGEWIYIQDGKQTIALSGNVLSKDDFIECDKYGRVRGV